MIRHCFRITFTLILSVHFFSSTAQINETFSDGNFTANPTWVGNVADWMVNTDLQLQSNNMVANSTFYLSTANTLATTAQWDFYTKIDFNPSSANYIDVFLTASASDISLATTTGYFVRIGNTDDEISLYRKDAGGAVIKIIDGANGVLNTSSSVMKIRVIRTAANQFILSRDLTAVGNNYVSEGVATDATYNTSAFFGFLVKQSTASFFQKHYFDDIIVQPYVPDVTPPAIQSVTATAPTLVDVLFNEPFEQTSAQTTGNYSVNNNVGNPIQGVRDASNAALVHLTFTTPFPNGVNNTITINSVKDIAGNAISNGTALFSFYIPQRYDVLIDEIFADPTPIILLPNAEYIELKNVNSRPINLQGWKLAGTTTTSSAFPSIVLQPDSFLIITSTTSAPLFSSYGAVLGIGSFPALIDAGTTLTLTSKEGATIHSVRYDISWYQNAVKSNGGWSLEMIDTKNPCSGSSNWQASIDPRGGTPGMRNSITRNNPDQIAPALKYASALDSITLLLTFDEPLDSAKATLAANYTISDGIGTPVSAITMSPTFTQVQLKLRNAITSGKIYTLTASNVTDCSGNIVQAKNTARVGLASVIDSNAIIINELLFNPKSDGVDYVEIYNKSSKVFDLKDLYITNRSTSTDALGTLRQLSTASLLMFPGDFFVISENGAIVQKQFVAKNIENFIDLATMPSYPDASGVVVLLNAQGTIVDELRYTEKWHFKLIDNKEGISIERIDYNKPTQLQDNWTSAASTAGFGTPGYQNSQFRSDLQPQGQITITPKTFSPDNNGFDDFTLIGYQMTDLGYVGNITIFDAAGRPVRSIAKNATLALTGSFRWDGLDDKQRKVPVGAYVVYTEIFNLSGSKKSFKNVVVVAANF